VGGGGKINKRETDGGNHESRIHIGPTGDLWNKGCKNLGPKKKQPWKEGSDGGKKPFVNHDGGRMGKNKAHSGGGVWEVGKESEKGKP